MGNDPIQFHFSPEDVRQIVQAVLLTVFGELAHCYPPGQIITIEDRCRERWPNATARNRRRIRDIFVASHVERLGYFPRKLNGYRNGTFVVEREHLKVLDDAIDLVMREVDDDESMPLFSHRPH
jgi:hypothetical protein